MTAVDLGKLLQGMVQSYPNLQPPAADIAIELTDAVVLGNESLLTQCFGNLLDNAVKFVAPGVKPHIRVCAQPVAAPAPACAGLGVGEMQRTGDSSGPPDTQAAASAPAPARRTAGSPGRASSPFVLLWVEDNGIGIPAEAQDKIFRMFHRVHRESEYPGTGIGLAIVKKAVQRMGGRICVESEPGRGTRVCVELRRAQGKGVGEERERLEEAA
jgi:signal transduction histidine kinase